MLLLTYFDSIINKHNLFTEKPATWNSLDQVQDSIPNTDLVLKMHSNFMQETKLKNSITVILLSPFCFPECFPSYLSRYKYLLGSRLYVFNVLKWSVLEEMELDLSQRGAAKKTWNNKVLYLEDFPLSSVFMVEVLGGFLLTLDHFLKHSGTVETKLFSVFLWVFFKLSFRVLQESWSMYLTICLQQVCCCILYLWRVQAFFGHEMK